MIYELNKISRICNISYFKWQPYITQVYRQEGVSSVSLLVYIICIYIGTVYHMG
jgi:hypothetical protein